MFRSYFTPTEMNLIEKEDQDLKMKLDQISVIIRDLEERFRYYLVQDKEIKFPSYTLAYLDNRIWYKDSEIEKRLIETKIDIRLKVSPFLHEFARRIMFRRPEDVKEPLNENN